jgi:hypothetical protein
MAFGGPLLSNDPNNPRNDQVEFQWGTVPNFPLLIGCVLSAQHASLDPAAPGGIGMSPAYWFTIDQQPPPAVTAVYNALEWSGQPGEDPDAPGRQGAVSSTTIVEFY